MGNNKEQRKKAKKDCFHIMLHDCGMLASHKLPPAFLTYANTHTYTYTLIHTYPESHAIHIRNT